MKPPVEVEEFKTIRLKCWPEPYEAIRSGLKTMEFRRNDRQFRVGDVLQLDLYDPETALYLGADLTVLITHIQKGFGIPEGFVAMSVRKIDLFSVRCNGCGCGFKTYDERHTHCAGCL